MYTETNGSKSGICTPMVKDHTYQRCWCKVSCVVSDLLVTGMWCGPLLGGAAAKILLEMDSIDVLQDHILNMGQLELAYVPVEG